MTLSWLTLLPPLMAIIFAVWKKEVILSLIIAIFTSELLLTGYQPAHAFIDTLERITSVFNSDGNTRILIFSLLIGALLMMVRHSGGVAAFVVWLVSKGVAKTPRQVSMVTLLTGVVVFIETNLSVLTSGIMAQSLFDKFKLSRARLAYIIDSTCAPISVVLLLNAWGAYILGLLESFNFDNPVEILVRSVPLNFYVWLTLAMVFYTAWSSRVHFSLASHEKIATQLEFDKDEITPRKIRFFVVPIVVLIGSIVGFMFYTGNGEILQGSGSKSVLWATALATLVAYLLLRVDGQFRHKQLVRLSFKGMAELLPLVVTVLLAFALGASMKQLGTGEFVAGIVSGNLPLWLIAPVIFIAAGIISFSTGTSWGTFGILIPIAIPVALETGIDPSLLLAAVLGGGVFGDHCSPISDTTIISSLAAGCDHLEHVRTQLPYSLTAALGSVFVYLLWGLLN